MEELKQRFQVARWIAEELAGIIRKEEQAELEAWRKESQANELEYQELQQECLEGHYVNPYPEGEVARQWKRFAARNKYPRLFFRNWYRYAVLVVLLVGVAGILKWKVGVKPEVLRPDLLAIPIAQGTPLLRLENGMTMMLDDSSVLFRGEALPGVRLGEGMIDYRQTDDRIGEEIYNTLIIPKGGEFRIQLADGSQVWLNSETELRYPVRFSGKERRVFLKGEAYFEVARNAQKPFVVTTSGGVDVSVLGTKFNVTSYDNDEQVMTTLAEGCVEVGNGQKTVRLQKEEQALFHKEQGSFQVQKVDVDLHLAWKEGKFIFEEQSLEQIMKQLQRWYEMNVFYTNEEVKHYTFSGNLKKYDDFDKIVRMLEEVAGIQISIKENCVIIGMK